MQETIDWKPIYEKLSEIDLYDTLSKLPIPQEIRKIFYDLLANRYIGNKAVESEELKEKFISNENWLKEEAFQ